MSDWPIHLNNTRVINYGWSSSTSRGTAVNPSSTANTKGSYVQLTASTAFPACWVLFQLKDISNADITGFLVDFAIGAASSEQVIASNLLVERTNVDEAAYDYMVPIYIPEGERLSVRCQSSGGDATDTVRANAVLFSQSFRAIEPYALIQSFGLSTSTSLGTQIDPGGTADTKGSYVQLVAATDENIRGIIIAVDGNRNTAASSVRWMIDVAIGAGGSEQVIIPNWSITINSRELMLPYVSQVMACYIASGQRIAVRAQCNSNDATDRLFNMAVYGIS